MNTPSPSIDHEYGQPAHITGHRLIIDLAGPVSLELADFEALEDEFKETLSKLNCIIERFKLTEQVSVGSVMLDALMACNAWHKAESDSIGSFNDRMELCNYSEWITRKAIAFATGEQFDEPYQGVPHLLISSGLGVHLHRDSADEASKIVQKTLTEQFQERTK